MNIVALALIVLLGFAFLIVGLILLAFGDDIVCFPWDDEDGLL